MPYTLKISYKSCICSLALRMILIKLQELLGILDSITEPKDPCTTDIKM